MADMHEIPELDKKGLREFGINTGAIIAVLFGLFFPWLFNEITLMSTYDFWGAIEPTTFLRWPWALGGLLAIWGLVAPSSLGPVYNTWMKFGLMMSKIMTPLVMGIVFYLVFAPVGLVMRLFGKDSMARKLDNDVDTYRVESKDNPVSNLEKPF